MTVTRTMTTETRLLDVNVLLALTDDGHPHFDPAHRWFGELPPVAGWATCPTTEASYHRLMMNPAVTGRSLDSTAVLAALDGLRSHRGHTFLADMTSLSNTRLDLAALVGSKQVTDFHLVNLAAASDAVLATFDRRLRDSLAPADQHLVELIPV